MAENPLDHRRIFDRGDEAQATAAGAGENVNFKDAPEKLGPGEVAPGRARRRTGDAGDAPHVSAATNASGIADPGAWGGRAHARGESGWRRSDSIGYGRCDRRRLGHCVERGRAVARARREYAVVDDEIDTGLRNEHREFPETRSG